VRRLLGVALALLVAGLVTAVNTTPASAATRDIRVHVANKSDTALTLAGQSLDHGCWNIAPPATIAIGQTVDIASESCGVATGTEFHVTYTLAGTNARMELHYDNPFVGSDSFDETAPQGYAFDAGGVIEDRTVGFGCDSKTCDGIPDDWKRNGVTIDPGGGDPPQFVDLPKMGVSLDRPNVLVQLDWMQDNTHDQRLRQAAIDTVIGAFDQDPVTYRGATRSGITLVVDAGPNSTITPGGTTWGSLSRAKQVAWTQDFLTGSRSSGYQLANFYTQVKSDLVAAGRLPIFHYAIAASEIAANDSTSGDTVQLGFMVTLGDWTGGVGSQDEQTGTFMHELGHTLGLDHSGGEGNADTVNFKPNYPSIMNYAYQTRGVFRGGTQVFDYSRDAMPDVIETALTETGGVSLGANPSGYGTTHSCGTKDGTGTVAITETDIQAALSPVDWNCDGTTPDGGTGFDANGDTVQGMLKGEDTSDWNRLRFKTGGVGAGADAKDTITVPGSGISEPSTELTREQDRLIRVLPVHTTLTYHGATSGDYHDGATMSATLLAPGDVPVPDKTITFGVGTGSGDACSAVTNATGTASCDVTITQVPATYPVTAAFDGDSIYRAASDSDQTFTVTREETSIAYTGDRKLANGTPANLAGALTEDGVTPIAGATVDLTMGSGATAQSCAGTTDGSGVARCTIANVAQPLAADARVPVAAAFDGDQYYLPSGASATATLTYLTGRAFGLSADVHLLLASLHLPPQPDTGPVRTASALTTATPCAASVDTLLVSAAGVCPNVTVTLAPGTSVGTSTVQNVTVGIPGLPLITATGVRSVSMSTCSGATGSVTIEHLTVGGAPVDTGVAPNTGIDLGGGAKLVLDEQLPVPGADHGLTVNALHLTVLGGTVDVVVGSSTSDVHNC
jgi:hypothetical protein